MAQSNNIIIGNAGIASQSNTIMIGDANQTSAYVAGVYGSSVGATYSPVYIDNNNQLGTTSSSLPTQTISDPFLAYQVGQTPAVLGTGTAYYLGSYIALTKAFDVGSNFHVGTGGGSAGKANGAYYQAPASGVYQFFMNIYVDTEGAGVTYYDYFKSQIETATNIYQYIETLPGGGAYVFPRVNNNFWFTFQCSITLVLGDKVWFNTNNLHSGGAALTSKVGDTGSIPGRSTRISGFRVA